MPLQNISSEMAVSEISFEKETPRSFVCPGVPVRPGKSRLHGWIVIAYIRNYTPNINQRQQSLSENTKKKKETGTGAELRWKTEGGREWRHKESVIPGGNWVQAMLVLQGKTTLYSASSDERARCRNCVQCFLQFKCKARLCCNLSETAGTFSSGAGRDRLWTCLVDHRKPCTCSRLCHGGPPPFKSTLHTAQHMLNMHTYGS